MPHQKNFNQPISGLVTPRFGGIATFMRLPHVPLEDAAGLDLSFTAQKENTVSSTRKSAGAD